MTTGGPTTITVDDATLWPSTNFFIVIDRDGENEEKLRVSSRSGLTLDIAERGADGTQPRPHAIDAIVEHVFTALEADQANAHIEAVDGVHGVPVGDPIASQGYARTQATDAEVNAKQYADTRDAATSAADRVYTDNEVAASTTESKAHADNLMTTHEAEPDPHPQYAEDADVTSAVSTHAALKANVHGIPANDEVAGVKDIETQIMAIFDGEYGGQKHRLVALKGEYVNPATNWSMNIARFNFTQRPIAVVTVKKNNASGAVAYVTMGVDPGNTAELKFVAVDARDGSRPSSLPDPIYFDIIMVGPVA